MHDKQAPTAHAKLKELLLAAAEGVKTRRQLWR